MAGEEKTEQATPKKRRDARKEGDVLQSKEIITAASVLGMIAIEGRNLKIENFSTDDGNLRITGDFDSISYYAKREKQEKSGLFSRLIG